MPVPLEAAQGPLGAYLQELEDRIAAREIPGSPALAFACTTALMPDATKYKNCVLLNTTLNILAHSDGANWIRQDTGAAI